MEEDHRRVGDAVRAVLRPGERLVAHSVLLRSPGLEEPPPRTVDVLKSFNPFAGFGTAVREDGLGLTLLGTALGLPPDGDSLSTLMMKDRVARKYGVTFCGVQGSDAGRLLDGLRRGRTGRAFWAARTDQRLLVFADQPPEKVGVLTLVHTVVGLVVSIVKILLGKDEPPGGFSGRLFPVFECPAAAVASSPAPPIAHMPRIVLWFADQSWLVVSAGAGEPGARLAAALAPGGPG